MTDAMTLLVLALGLVLGGLCAVVWLKLRVIAERTMDAVVAADRASIAAEVATRASDTLRDAQNKHDHEIAWLYDRAGQRRQ